MPSVMHGLAEVAGQNRYSVLGLRELGVDAETVVMEPHPSGYGYDVMLGRPEAAVPAGSLRGRLAGLAGKASYLAKASRRFDVFHFHFGQSFFRCRDVALLRAMGKRCFFEFHGSDLRDYEAHAARLGQELGHEAPLSEQAARRNAIIFKEADGIVLHDDELMRYVPQVHPPIYVVPLRVDLGQFHASPPAPDNGHRIKVVHAPSNRSKKGTSFVIEAFGRLRETRPDLDLELCLVEGMTRKEAFGVYADADVIVDQLLIGTYGVFSIEAMALGKPVVAFIDDEMRGRLPEALPIVSATCGTIGPVLERLADDPWLRKGAGEAGRRYVEDYHDHLAVARVLLDIYRGVSPALAGRAAFEQVKRIRRGVHSDAG